MRWIVGIAAVAVPLMGVWAWWYLTPSQGIALTTPRPPRAPTNHALAAEQAGLNTNGRDPESQTTAATPEERVKLAKSWIGDARAISGKVSEAGFRAIASEQIAEALAGLGDYEQAKQTAASIDEFHARLSASLSIATTELKAGHVAEAKKALQELREAVLGNADARETISALCAITRVQVQVGDAAEAKRTLEFAKQMEAKVSNPFKRDSVRHWIASAQAIAGDVAGAKRTAATIGDAVARAGAFGAISDALAVSGDISGAKQTAAEIDLAYQRVQALLTIAERQRTRGDVAGGKLTLAAAISAAAGLGAGDDRSQSYSNIAKGQANLGDAVQALATAQGIADSMCKDLAYRAISIAQMTAGDSAGADATTKRMSDPTLGAVDFELSAVKAYAKRADVEKAEASAKVISNSYWRAEAYLEIARAQLKAGRTDKAQRLSQLAMQAAATAQGTKGSKAGIFAKVAAVLGTTGGALQIQSWQEAERDPYLRVNILVGGACGLSGLPTESLDASVDIP